MKTSYLKRLFIITALIFSTQVYAVSCYVTLYKSNCWLDYDVKVDVLDATNNKPVSQIDLPQGKAWTRVVFNCVPSSTYKFLATFSPVIWENEAGKVYQGIQFWQLPKALTDPGGAWTLELCFPKAFQAVPYPPDVTEKCVCDPKGIPPIQLPVKDEV